MVEFKKGDMFSENFDIIINTVNCIGISGAGVALLFKQKFPDNYKEYRKKCLNGELMPGDLFINKINADVTIVNFATKDHFKSPSKYIWITSGLIQLRDYLESIKYKKTIAMPKIGCGLGGLNWQVVKGMIEKELGGLEDIIYIFE